MTTEEIRAMYNMPAIGGIHGHVFCQCGADSAYVVSYRHGEGYTVVDRQPSEYVTLKCTGCGYQGDELELH